MASSTRVATEESSNQDTVKKQKTAAVSTEGAAAASGGGGGAAPSLLLTSAADDDAMDYEYQSHMIAKTHFELPHRYTHHPPSGVLHSTRPLQHVQILHQFKYLDIVADYCPLLTSL